jgi:hypothetical protein
VLAETAVPVALALAAAFWLLVIPIYAKTAIIITATADAPAMIFLCLR